MSFTFFGKLIKAGALQFRNKLSSPFSQLGISWFQEKKLKHQGYNMPGQITLKGIPVKYQHPPELIHSLREIFISDIYKLSLDNNQPVILDCGANIGLSILSIKLQYPDAEIIAFEPDTSNFALLNENTRSFNKVTLVNKAVWDIDGFVEFEMGGTQGSAVGNSRKTNATEKIGAVRLRNYLNREIDFLKIDIEGAEYKVLTDCSDQLGNVKNLFLEYHGKFEELKRLNEILEILVSSGFYYYIKEADPVYATPFAIDKRRHFDLQLNIFAFKTIPS